MKGVVFVNFANFVEETWGLEFWDEVIQATSPASEGAYTRVTSYPDEELLSFVAYICDSKHIAVADALRTFGQWVFTRLHAIAPPNSTNFDDAFAFLRGVQDVIHTEVKKLTPDAILPEFRFLNETSDSLEIEYMSPRHLCFFCEGLILGLGEYLNQPLSITHVECVHDNDKRCIMRVTKNA